MARKTLYYGTVETPKAENPKISQSSQKFEIFKDQHFLIFHFFESTLLKSAKIMVILIQNLLFNKMEIQMEKV